MINIYVYGALYKTYAVSEIYTEQIRTSVQYFLADVDIVRVDYLPRGDIFSHVHIYILIIYSTRWCVRKIFFLGSTSFELMIGCDLMEIHFSFVQVYQYRFYAIEHTQMSCINEHVSLAFLDELRCSFLRFFYIFVYAHISQTLCLRRY